MSRTICRFVLIIISALILPSFVAAQDIVYWQAKRPLTWNDFNGRRPQKTRFAAAIVSRISCNVYDEKHDSVYVEVKSLTFPDKSWTRNKHYRPYVLKHEQTHFDITELYARRLRRSISQCKKWYTHNGTYRYTKLTRLYHRYRRRWRWAEYWCDFQTRHGRKRQVQLAWNYNVESSLKALEQYALPE